MRIKVIGETRAIRELRLLGLLLESLGLRVIRLITVFQVGIYVGCVDQKGLGCIIQKALGCVDQKGLGCVGKGFYGVLFRRD